MTVLEKCFLKYLAFFLAILIPLIYLLGENSNFIIAEVIFCVFIKWYLCFLSLLQFKTDPPFYILAEGPSVCRRGEQVRILLTSVHIGSNPE